MTNSPPPPPPPGSRPDPPPGWSSEPPGPSSWSSGFPEPPPGAGTPGPPPAPPGWSPAEQPPKRSGLAIAALVLGIVAIPLFIIFIPALLALIFGLVAASTIKKQSVRERLGLARAGWILGVVSMVGGIAAWVAIAVFVSDTKAWHELEAGDCVDFDFMSWDGTDRIDVPDCSDTHNGEVVAVEEFNESQDSDYPSRTELGQMADELCIPALEEYTGEDFQTGPYTVFPLLPDERAWKDAKGKFVCVGSDNDRGDRTGSIEG